MQNRHRVFIAINLPEEVKSSLAKVAMRYPELPAKWEVKQNLHITLVFLGYLTDLEIAEVCRAVKEICQNHTIFSITLKDILYGPAGKMPKMVWVQGEKSAEPSQLKHDLEERLLQKINFKPEGRAFSPHSTLAKIHEWEFRKLAIQERPQVHENLDTIFSVESVEVMESVLKKSGPEYAILESHSLQQ